MSDRSLSKNYYIPNNPNFGFSDIGNAYAIITDIRTGDMMHATDGVVDATYANCVIPFTKHAVNTDWAGGLIPRLYLSKDYAITIYETAGTPAAGDAIKIGPNRFDPESCMTFTDVVPVMGNRIRGIDR